MERNEGPAIQHTFLWTLHLIGLFCISCSGENGQRDGASFYRNMEKGVYNIVAEVQPTDTGQVLVLKGSIDKQPLEQLTIAAPDAIIDAALGDANADGIPELYCLCTGESGGSARLHAFAIDGQRFKPIEVQSPPSNVFKGHRGKDVLSIQDTKVIHQFSKQDSADKEISREVYYTLQRQNGNYRLLHKPELEELAESIMNSGVHPFLVGSRIRNIELPEGVNLQKEERTIRTEEGPSEEWVYTVIANDVILMELYSYEGLVIDEIFLLDSHFKTADEISVRSKLADFTAAYPNYKLWYTYVSDRFIAETPTLPNVQFLIERDAYAGPVGKLTDSRSEQSTLSIEDFTKEARIEQIRIF